MNAKRWHLFSGAWAWAALALAWGLAFALACRLSAGLPAMEEGTARSSVAGALTGGSRTALSGYFYEMADDYFHRGVGHVHKEMPVSAFFQRMAAAIAPASHVHRGGQDVREIMPWLWLAIRANPHDADLYLVTAYWLANAMQSPEVAREVLEEGAYSNPRDYQIRLAQGQLDLKEKRYAEARRALDAALAFWPGGTDPEGQDAKQDKRSILIYRGLLYETTGENEKALVDYEEIVRLFPAATGFRDRLPALRARQRPRTGVAAALGSMQESSGTRMARCPREAEEQGREDE